MLYGENRALQFNLPLRMERSATRYSASLSGSNRDASRESKNVSAAESSSVSSAIARNSIQVRPK